MTRSLILGTVLGGIIAFLWSFVAWELLPFHHDSLHGLANEDATVAALSAAAPRTGVYFAPFIGQLAGASEPERKAAEAALMEKTKRGPIVFVSIRHGAASFAESMMRGLLIFLLGALMLTWLQMQARGLSYIRRVGFLAVAGGAVWVLGHLPNWNWWGFSSAYTFAHLLDSVAGWFLAGLAIARVAAPKPTG